MNKDWNNVKGIKITTPNNLNSTITKKIYTYKNTFTQSVNDNLIDIDNIDVNINSIIEYEFNKLLFHTEFTNNSTTYWINK